MISEGTDWGVLCPGNRDRQGYTFWLNVEVRLAIATSEGLVNLEMLNVATEYCPELHRQLTQLIGEGGLNLENK